MATGHCIFHHSCFPHMNLRSTATPPSPARRRSIEHASHACKAPWPQLPPPSPPIARSLEITRHAIDRIASSSAVTRESFISTFEGQMWATCRMKLAPPFTRYLPPAASTRCHHAFPPLLFLRRSRRSTAYPSPCSPVIPRFSGGSAERRVQWMSTPRMSPRHSVVPMFVLSCSP